MLGSLEFGKVSPRNAVTAGLRRNRDPRLLYLFQFRRPEISPWLRTLAYVPNRPNPFAFRSERFAYLRSYKPGLCCCFLVQADGTLRNVVPIGRNGHAILIERHRRAVAHARPRYGPSKRSAWAGGTLLLGPVWPSLRFSRHEKSTSAQSLQVLRSECLKMCQIEDQVKNHF